MENKVMDVEIIETNNGVLLPPIIFDVEDAVLNEITKDANEIIIKNKDIDPISLDNKELKIAKKDVETTHKKVKQIRFKINRIAKDLISEAKKYEKSVKSKADELISKIKPTEDELGLIREKIDKEIDRRANIIKTNVEKMNSLIKKYSILDTIEKCEEVMSIEILGKEDLGNYYDTIKETIDALKERAKQTRELLLEQERAKKKEQEAKEFARYSSLLIKQINTLKDAEDIIKEAEDLINRKEALGDFYNQAEALRLPIINRAKTKISEFKKNSNIQRAKELKKILSIKLEEALKDENYINSLTDDFFNTANKQFEELHSYKQYLDEDTLKELQELNRKYYDLHNTIKEHKANILDKKERDVAQKLSKETNGLFENNNTTAETIQDKNEETKCEDVEKYIDAQIGFIEITRKEYARLLRDSFILQNLQINGVDNWEHYSEAYPYDEDIINYIEGEMK